ncbi:hypothetical protein IF188_02980 [Microbacterium sp. NEAU-LLC]|uniref:DUF4352 domain-containing protein n=2 Tax=Microbacterium helvum TaxID=2773713 RepID=A0ABR8NNR0_9MICO|nr:hypothetical protein [Microbacterium helvum]
MLPSWAAWTIGLIFIVAAWFVSLATPGDVQKKAPFEVPATIGQAATGRNIAVTFTDLRRADTVNATAWSAEGNWLVVDLDAEAVLTETGASLRSAQLRIDGKQFDASERPKSFYRGALHVGVPQSGSLAFELPADLRAGEGRIELALNGVNPELDSMIVLTIDLADVPAVDETDLLTTGWTNP